MITFFPIHIKTQAEQEVADQMAVKAEHSKYKLRQKYAKVEQALEEQFMTGRVLGKFIL